MDKFNLTEIEKQAELLASYQITGAQLLEYLKSVGLIVEPEISGTLNIDTLTKEFFVDFILGTQLYRFIK